MVAVSDFAGDSSAAAGGWQRREEGRGVAPAVAAVVCAPCAEGRAVHANVAAGSV